MKRALLFLSLTIAPAIVAPSVLTPSAVAQHAPTEAQRDAIRQWAGVIRRCKTSSVMSQVYDLLDEVCAQVEAQDDMANNAIFLGSLKQMRTAARLKARGLESHNNAFLDAAEATIRSALRLVRA